MSKQFECWHRIHLAGIRSLLFVFGSFSGITMVLPLPFANTEKSPV